MHTFTPHLTVGRVRSPEAFREALDVAAKLDITVDTIASVVSIYRVESDRERLIESEVPLG